MAQGRGLFTDQLSSVIQVIQLGNQSGVLLVERGEGIGLERGEIIFLQGQIVQAYGSSFSGQQALYWLSTWGVCRFTFTPTGTPSGKTGPLHTAPSRQNTHAYLQMPGAGSGSSPAHALSMVESSFAATTVPQRLMSGDEALLLLDQVRLSRWHRHLLLLIDGRRTTTELVHLMGKKYTDVCRLLVELEQMGIIQKKYEAKDG